MKKGKELALHLMDVYGISNEWTFRYNQAKVTFGVCDEDTMEIILSEPLTKLNKESFVENIILHEIAHALVGVDHEHDECWRTQHLSMGGDGEEFVTHRDFIPFYKCYDSFTYKGETFSDGDQIITLENDEFKAYLFHYIDTRYRKYPIIADCPYTGEIYQLSYDEIYIGDIGYEDELTA